MSEKHTEGPWEWDANVWNYDPEQEAPWLVSAGNDKVLFGQIGCTSESNARLIAAAPDLLDALTQAEYAVNKSVSGLTKVGYMEWIDIMLSMQKAISKATEGAS